MALNKAVRFSELGVKSFLCMSNPLVKLAFVVRASVAKWVAHQFVFFRGAALQNSAALGPLRARASGGLFLVGVPHG